MGLELFLLCCLIFILGLVICFWVEKTKRLHDRNQVLPNRIARRHERNSSDSFVNTTYVDTESGIFPGAPPPYTHADPPPKYEDVIKSQVEVTINRVPLMVREPPSAPSNMAPPPYTITV
ncbi:uncharacterized protein isoform X5 [Leptinotarsa decemlineata]|uniref:uncharacterized protein isoform X5 n=1 Tax=Leptinotarsa decemlineata TaxID=7539 RepID=UPI000C252B93|nr:uncharacterized protein LOC111518011 isoform X5 [Leptinotarsa decemlineata]